jgi:HAE1 family hydrophobic/amphiphilic exporter-1
VISLPLGVMGAYFGQKIMGLENNIYFQIALIMLVGLLAKMRFYCGICRSEKTSR